MPRSLHRARAALLLGLAALAPLSTGCESPTTTTTATEGEGATSEPRRDAQVVTRVLGATELDDAAHDALKRQLLTALDEASREAPGYRFVLADPSAGRADDDGAAARAELRFVMLPADGGEREVRFTLMLELEPVGEGGSAGAGELELTVETHTVRRDDESREAMRRRAVEEAAAALAHALADAARVEDADTDALVAILSDPGSGEALLLRAVREAGSRGEARLGEPLRALLVHPSRELVLASLTMLGQLRHRESVGAIRELLTSPDVAKLEHALLALGEIGGPDAEAALTEMARSHPDPRVRELASRLLLRLME